MSAPETTTSAQGGGADAVLSWVVNIDGEVPAAAKHNGIRTTKYTFLDFIPRNLFHQFHRVSNVYFLVCACLNFSPEIAAFGASVAFIPLIFVLSVTAAKDLYEDSRRRSSDKKVNAKKALRYDPGTKQIVEIEWSKVRCGDILNVKSGGQIPADMLLLHSSDKTGLAFVDTAELDGETNLKARNMFAKRTSDKFDASNYNAPVRCEPPSLKIYEFVGITEADGKNSILGPDNLLLRGCTLRNTTEVYGLVLYTGAQSKIMLNNTGPKLKRSYLEAQMNSGILICICLMVTMALISAIGTGIKDDGINIDDVPFVDNDGNSKGLNAFIRFFTWWVILQALVPLSLYVTIEVVKLMQVALIHQDIELYDEEHDTAVQCRAFNITEDLGQIEYVFSDKTGTLTQNLMVFRCCCISGVDYPHGFNGLTEASDLGSASEGAKISLDLSLSERIGNIQDLNDDCHLFMLSMAIGNTVRPDIVPELQSVATEPRVWEKGSIKFESESPDETAFVSAAEDYGYTLVAYAASEKVVNINGNIHKYKLLATLPFDSTRKRMSVILEAEDGKLLMLCKGADSAILKRLASDNPKETVRKVQDIVDKYSCDGLRTLAWACRELEPDMCKHWLKRWEEARSSLGSDKADRMMDLMMEIESQLHLLGTTGVEDALQAGVPHTIAALRRAGINVWVLTGDKQETAIQIAHTAQLFTSETRILLLNSTIALEHVDELSPEQVEAHSRKCVEDVKKRLLNLKEISENTDDHVECGLVVDGSTLAYCMSDDSNKEALVELAMKCSTVVCCRSTPLQKAQVVLAVRAKLPVLTLAIGDGANDASMIQTAHVGVGISGREGMQAVMASDFAISQFRFLEKLLFVHGHWNYCRISFLIMYFMFKNTMANVALFFFGPFSWFSGALAQEPLGVLLFYIVFTSLPPAVSAVLDQVVSAPTLLANPVLYEYGRLNRGYSKKKVLINILDGLLSAALIYFLSYGMADNTHAALYQFGMIQTATTISVANLWVAQETKNQTWIDLLGQVFSFLLYLAFCYVYYGFEEMDAGPDPHGLFEHSWGIGWWWAGCALITITIFIGRLGVITLQRFYWPTLDQLAREAEIKNKGPIITTDDNESGNTSSTNASKSVKKVSPEPETKAVRKRQISDVAIHQISYI